jgi:uroporphyrinogen-III decarboxylase
MEAMEPFKSLSAYTPYSGLPMGYLMSFTRPDIRKLYKTLLDAGKELTKLNKVTHSCRLAAIKAGFPILRSGYATAPFDLLGDSLRGTRGIMIDLYRQPEKILEAMEVITPHIIASGVAAANRSECPIISIPLHKGQDSFMSKEQFEKYYWPPLRNVITGLANEGIVSLVGAEGRYGSRLEPIKDMPKGTTIWWFEETNMADAKKALRGIACIAGNVPASLLTTGTPQDVKEYCRKTIEEAGDGGGLILDGTQSMQNCNPENFQAMLDAAKDYGVY